MKKILLILPLFLILTSCTTSTSLSYTFNVDTGDSIKLELDTSDGYGISAQSPFDISEDDEILSTGKFIPLVGYDELVIQCETSERITIIEKITTDEIEYIFYNSNEGEYNYVIKVLGSNTGMVILNYISEESAKECFERLTITKES